MSENWQVGDLALCVDIVPRGYTARGHAQLKKGAVYRVEGLRVSPQGSLNLFLEGVVYPKGLGTRADRFRKIRPDEHEACEPEFVTLLKRTKRKVSA